MEQTPRFRPSNLNAPAITLAMVRYLAMRQALVGRFGVEDPKVGYKAIEEYRRTIHPEIKQIFVEPLSRRGADLSDTTVVATVVSANAQEFLWRDNTFLRYRYPPSSSPQGQYKTGGVEVLRAWGQRIRLGWNSPARWESRATIACASRRS